MSVHLAVPTTLDPGRAWAAVTDWPEHGRHVPLTTIRTSETGFVARTGLDALGVGFDDPMTITDWQPPELLESGWTSGHCALVKTGRVVRGHADLRVTPRADGSVVTWSEQVRVGPRRLERVTETLTGWAQDGAGAWLFGRLLRRLLASAEDEARRLQ